MNLLFRIYLFVATVALICLLTAFTSSQPSATSSVPAYKPTYRAERQLRPSATLPARVPWTPVPTIDIMDPQATLMPAR